MKRDCFIPFGTDLKDTVTLPERFTFPFNYEPHPLCIQAAKELQTHLVEQTEWVHNFGLHGQDEETAIGKMFGVLIVQKPTGELGYLSAFSGKLANSNHHSQFVPPVFDMLKEEGFYRRGEEELNAINREVEQLQQDDRYKELQQTLTVETTRSEEELANQRVFIKAQKKERDQKRKEAKEELTAEAFEELQKQFSKESQDHQRHYKRMAKEWKIRLEDLKEQIAIHQKQIKALKDLRKQKSADLQKQLFNQYTFLNQAQEEKSLWDIFKHTPLGQPPSGAGECAAPKLLQYAFMNGLKPIAMAEFWWGKSPASEIRKHGHFYPACRGKCEPILGHMLQGMPVDENPMLKNPAEGKELEIVYEDEVIVIVNKPEEFLSVPGKTITDSVYERMLAKYPKATGPLVVHRLDMSTSGLMLIAKTKMAHEVLQDQFEKRQVKKRYIAQLEGRVEGERGTIELPLRVDLDNRPQQLVCYEHGKPATTHWKVIDRSADRTLVHFFPVTGRTHQLRVHAAHPKGLNAPIVGDDLYGTREQRLHLHAEQLEFLHPVTRKKMVITSGKPSFL
ncbi:RluA family pseudouridine synthase [Algivirga pacifica]|uniref:Pseudouridine synthase n=1 Tax=Algivirga pacifica TaxID=1162670 RepID=A0ABP9DLW6_9BACT